MKRTLFLFVAFPLLAFAGPDATPPLRPDVPRLAVVISIDQCRADYLQRFRPYFVEGGFRRLTEQGADYRSAHHKHAMTATAPGHATILTGVSASRHGIIANEWFDAGAGRVIGSVEDPKAPVVGAVTNIVRVLGSPDAELSGSPRQLLSTTVGDQLKLRYGAGSKVISVANKDRAAIFLGGRLADAAYWSVDGRIVTSRYYRDALPAWVAQFNAEDRINRAFGTTWDRLLDASVYEAVQGPDDGPGEDPQPGLGRTFPRKIDGGLAAPGPAFYTAYRNSPYWSAALGELAQRAVVEEQLGRHAAPDLLCIGFSQLDYIGHAYGPDSHELMDSVLRLDRVLAELLAFLDREVGLGRYVVVLTADHGVAPLPERVQALNRGVRAGRLDRPALNAAVDAALTTAFGAPANGAAWTIRDGYGFRLVAATLAARNITAPAAEAVVKAALLRSPQIALAWTREELLGHVPAYGLGLEAWRLSFNAERSPDVMFSLPPYVVDRARAGTNHGTPNDYDAHIPIVWYGAGVKPGVHLERVGTDAIAPTLAGLLGVPRPPEAAADPLF